MIASREKRAAAALAGGGTLHFADGRSCDRRASCAATTRAFDVRQRASRIRRARAGRRRQRQVDELSAARHANPGATALLVLARTFTTNTCDRSNAPIALRALVDAHEDSGGSSETEETGVRGQSVAAALTVVASGRRPRRVRE